MLVSSYYLHDEDGGTSSQKGSKLERTDLLHSCQAREFVQTELVEGMYDTCLQLVRSHRFTQERNKQECEFVACAIDFLVKDVGGGSYSYFGGTDVLELMVRRLQSVMTVDGKKNQVKAWQAVRAYMAPVQGAAGVFMNPQMWAAADKQGALYGDSGAGGGGGDTTN